MPIQPDKLNAALQRIRQRMFLWLWQTTFSTKQVFLDRLERIEQMREGTLAGGLPRIVRVVAKDPTRVSNQKTAMRLDPAHSFTVVGSFIFFHFVPLPGPFKPLLYHQWGAGGKGTDIELVGLPVGGRPLVMKSAESPNGMIRTSERRALAVHVPGEVPGYHFRSWDGWLWFEVTTAAGDAFAGAWEVVRALGVVHVDDIARSFDMPDRSSLPFIPPSVLGTPYHFARSISTLYIAVDLCTNPGRHSEPSGSGVELEGWELGDGRIQAGERVVLRWKYKPHSTEAEHDGDAEIAASPEDGISPPNADAGHLAGTGGGGGASGAASADAGERGQPTVLLPSAFDGWLSASLRCPGCRPWACLAGRARAEPPAAAGRARGGAARGEEGRAGSGGASREEEAAGQPGEAREAGWRVGEGGCGGSQPEGASATAGEGAVGPGEEGGNEGVVAGEAAGGAAGAGEEGEEEGLHQGVAEMRVRREEGGREGRAEALEGGCESRREARVEMVVQGQVAACEHAFLCLGDNAGWGGAGRGEESLMDIGERLHEAVPMTVRLRAAGSQADDAGAERWLVEGVELLLPLHVVNAWLRGAGRLEDREPLTLSAMEREAGVRVEGGPGSGVPAAASGNEARGAVGVRERRDGITCPYRRVRWTGALNSGVIG